MIHKNSQSSFSQLIDRLTPFALVLATAIGCGRSDQIPKASTTRLPVRSVPETVASESRSSRSLVDPIHFHWLSPDESGIDFMYYGNPSPEHYMTEQNGGGVALFDYDRDGWTDVFLVNGSHFDRPADPVRDTHRLYRNQFSQAEALYFSDVSQNSRLNVCGFGMGAAAGDYDNDGFTDLFICCYGQDLLWHNNGDGTFENVTRLTGVSDPQWSASAAFADLDADGDLDLYVTNYVVYSPTDAPCFTQHQTPIKISCGPIGRTGEPDRLWENLGDGRFQDSSETSGIHAVEPGKGLAVEIVDLDGDDLLDIYVANDTSENFLFHNEGGLRFKEIGKVVGVAFNENGTPGSSMGIACADFDRNGRLDLFVTNFENATNDYYDNLYESTFVHRSGPMGLDTSSRPMLAFGTVPADFDLDGWPDLFVANGHIWDLRSLDFGHMYEMPPQMFHNERGRRFKEASSSAGAYFDRKWLGRAVAMADLDRDGDADLVVTHELQPAAILRNDSTLKGRSTVLRLIGTISAREPLGMRIHLELDNAIEHVPSGGSFQASHESQIVVACAAAIMETLTAHWKNGSHQVWRLLPSGSELYLVEGATIFKTVTPMPNANN